MAVLLTDIKDKYANFCSLVETEGPDTQCVLESVDSIITLMAKYYATGVTNMRIPDDDLSVSVKDENQLLKDKTIIVEVFKENLEVDDVIFDETQTDVVVTVCILRALSFKYKVDMADIIRDDHGSFSELGKYILGFMVKL